MPLFVKTKRYRPTIQQYTEIARIKSIASLELLRPFLETPETSTSIELGLYKYYLNHHSKEYPAIETSSKPQLAEIEKKINTIYKTAQTKWKNTYNSILKILLHYQPPKHPKIPIILITTNGPLEDADIILDTLTWIHNDKIIQTLEETLETIEHPKLLDIIKKVTNLNEKLRKHGLTVDRAVVADDSTALTDLENIKILWIPSITKILSIVLETLAHKNDEESILLYDYYAPYRKDLIVNMIGRRKEFTLYIKSRKITSNIKFINSYNLIVYPINGNKSLKILYNYILNDIIKPYANEVLEKRKSQIIIKTNIFIEKYLSKLNK